MLLAFSASSWLLPSIELLFVASASQFVQQVLTNSLIQVSASDEYQGRMVSFFSLFSNGLTRLKNVPAGAVAQAWNAPIAVAGGALLTLLWTSIVLWRVPFVRWAEASIEAREIATHKIAAQTQQV